MSDDDSSSLSVSLTLTDTPSILEPDYPLNEDLNDLWGNFLLVAEHHEPGLIHPLHLALILLYNDLTSIDDGRLIDTKPGVSLDKSLFWVSISKAAVFRVHDHLDDHWESASVNGNPNHHQVSIGAKFREAILDLEESELQPPQVEIHPGNQILESCTGPTKLVLDRAKELQNEMDDAFMAPQHILLALLENEQIRHILEAEEVVVDNMINLIKKQRKPITSRKREPRFRLLSLFATDLTNLAQEELARQEMSSRDTNAERGKYIMNPTIGRNAEIRRLVAILSRRSKNNAVLLGDPGVGKTAIAEGLAFRIVKGEVPEPVTTRVFSLDLGALLATTACKSAYEQIISDILEEIADHEERGLRVILFMDELSQMTIGGYRDDGAGIDAATLMKPFLGQGKLRCVGCSTFEDYRSSIEKDGALARQFSPVFVCQPSVAETVEILRGLKDVFQSFHGVQILDEAFTAAASLASQYFTHKRLPDSAIDLLDDACSSAKTDGGRSEQLWKLRRDKVAVELEIRAMEQEIDGQSDSKLVRAIERRKTLEKKIARLSARVQSTWRFQSTVREIDEDIRRSEDAIKELGQAGQLKEKRILIQKLLQLRKEKELRSVEHRSAPNGPRHMSDAARAAERKKITALNIAKAASYYTLVPQAESKNHEKREMIDHVYEALSGTVINQPEAVDATSSAIRCMLAGVTDQSRPVASLMFGGPSGSGKKWLIKEVSRLLSQGPDKVVRINGGEYTEPHTLSKLIGTPACTGFDKGGQLTECVRRRPFSIIHIHEIEKAYPEFLLKIQTLLDEGHLTDGANKTVDFSNCLVFITTSIGQSTANPSASYTEQRSHYLTAIRDFFPLDFLARIDELIVFESIGSDSLPSIIDSHLNGLGKRLSQLQLHLVVHDSVKSYLTAYASRPGPGSSTRKLDAVLNSQILRPLANLMLRDVITGRCVVRLMVRDGEGGITIETAPYVPMLTGEGGDGDGQGSGEWTDEEEVDDAGEREELDVQDSDTEEEECVKTPFLGFCMSSADAGVGGGSGGGAPFLQLQPQKLY